MIVGIGLDLVETERIASALADHGSAFERRVFTDGEIETCRGRADRIQALAARFAAKEACLKALGTGWSRGLAFRDVDVTRDPSGRPGIRLSGRAADRARELGVGTVHVTLTHQPGIAAAVVVMEDGG